MSGVACVSEGELQAFVLGQLPPRVAQAVARHLDLCPACEEKARLLDRQTDHLASGSRDGTVKVWEAESIGPGSH